MKKVPDDPGALRKTLHQQILEYRLMEENYLTLHHRFFGKSSEKLNDVLQGQQLLFNEVEGGFDLKVTEQPDSEENRKLSKKKALTNFLLTTENRYDKIESKYKRRCKMKKVNLDLTKQQLNSAEMNQLIGGTEKTRTRTRTKTKSTSN